MMNLIRFTDKKGGPGMKRLSILLTCVVSLLLSVGWARAVAPNLVAREQVEPQAGKWDTWVLKSSNELRPKPPPNASETATELAQLKSLVASSDPNAQAQVTYWDAGTPSYRWLELAFDRYGKGPPNPFVSRALALLNVAIYDAIVATWDAKYHYNRPRPGGIVPRIPVPASPSYPSEHAAAAGAASTVLAYLFPEEKDFFTAKAEEAAQSRLMAQTPNGRARYRLARTSGLARTRWRRCREIGKHGSSHLQAITCHRRRRHMTPSRRRPSCKRSRQLREPFRSLPGP
jgi:hypothetical protein